MAGSKKKIDGAFKAAKRHVARGCAATAALVVTTPLLAAQIGLLDGTLSAFNSVFGGQEQVLGEKIGQLPVLCEYDPALVKLWVTVKVGEGEVLRQRLQSAADDAMQRGVKAYLSGRDTGPMVVRSLGKEAANDESGLLGGIAVIVESGGFIAVDHREEGPVIRIHHGEEKVPVMNEAATPDAQNRAGEMFRQISGVSVTPLVPQKSAQRTAKPGAPAPGESV